MDLAEVLRAHLELPKMILPHKIDYAKVGLQCGEAAVFLPCWAPDGG